MARRELGLLEYLTGSRSYGDLSQHTLYGVHGVTKLRTGSQREKKKRSGLNRLGRYKIEQLFSANVKFHYNNWPKYYDSNQSDARWHNVSYQDIIKSHQVSMIPEDILCARIRPTGSISYVLPYRHGSRSHYTIRI